MYVEERNTFEDDASLWNSFITGNNDAYGRIYQKYAQSLFSQGLQFTSDRELIKDCIHDLFVKIYNNRNSLKPTDNIKLYLFVALKNSLYNAFKKQKIHFTMLDETIENNSIEDNYTAEDRIIDMEIENIQQHQINNIFSLLTARQREAIHYRFIECMSIDEICILMEMNYQSVQNLLQRSIKKIRDSLIIIDKK